MLPYLFYNKTYNIPVLIIHPSGNTLIFVKAKIAQKTRRIIILQTNYVDSCVRRRRFLFAKIL